MSGARECAGVVGRASALVLQCVIAATALCAASTVAAQTNYWDGVNTTPGGVAGGRGGNGNWDVYGSTTNWTTSNGSTNSWWPAGNTIAIFGGTAGTVTLSDTRHFGGMTFNTTGYVVNGYNLTGDATNNVITVASGVRATVNTVLATGAGSNTYEKAGAGTLTLGGISTYTGATAITGGTLVVGAGGTNGSIDSNASTSLASGTLLKFNRSNAYSSTKVISGAGRVEQAGSGTTTMSAANTYTGTTTVSGGTLLVTGSTSTGATTVQSGGTLGGTGTLSNTVTVQSGGTLAPGLSPGTLTMSGLVLGSGSVLSMELGQAGTPGGSLNDLVQVNGGITLSGGTLNIAQSSGGTFEPGIYRLINYTGSCTGCAAGGLTLGSLPAGVTASRVTIDYRTANQINLIVVGPQQYWDGSNTSAGGSTTGGDGGTGTWDGITTNWTSGTGSFNGKWANGGVAIFQGTSGDVTVSGTQSIGGLTFDVAHNIRGDSLNGTAMTNTVINNAAVAVYIDSVISGSKFAFTKGDVTLRAANTYTGGTTINGSANVFSDNALSFGTGTVQIDTGGTATLRNDYTWTSPFVLGGGTLRNFNTGSGGTASGTITQTAASRIANQSGIFTFNNSIANAGFGITFNVAGSSTTNVSGVISGGGGLEQRGSGVLNLSAANSYSGGTNVNNTATLKLGINGALPMASVTTVASGATLDLNGFSQTLSGGLSADGNLKMGTNGALTLSGGMSTMAGASVTGSGKIVVGSGATLTLTSALANSGVEIELAGGTLNLGNYVHGIGKLTVSAASTLDFDVGTAGLSATNFAVTASGTAQVLTVSNWTRGTDVFQAAQINGATATARNTAGLDPLSRIQMGGASAAATLWRDAGASPANEITTGIATVKLQKTITGGAGGTFTFAQTNLASTPASIAVSTANTATPATPAAIAVTTLGTAVTLTETPASPYTLSGVSCIDANGATTGNGSANVATKSGNVLTIPAINVKAGADFTCVITNQYNELNHWDGGNATAGGSTVGGDGGNGTWDANTTNWTSATGTPNGKWASGSVAIFGSAPGTVNVGSVQSIGGLTFNTTGYTLAAGGGGKLSSAGTAAISANTNVKATINTELSGAGAYTFDGGAGASLVLGGTNTFTGAATVNSGLTILRNANALGGTSSGTRVAASGALQIEDVAIVGEAIALNGSGDGAGALRGNASVGLIASSNGPITLESDSTIGVLGATFTVSGAVDLNAKTLTLHTPLGRLNMQGVISGTTGIKKTGANGDAAIAGINTYTGVTAIEQGLLIAFGSNALGSVSSGTVVSAGGALALYAGSGGTLTMAPEPLSVAGIGGSGYGALISVSGTNTYPGPVTLTAAASIGSTSSQLFTVSGTINTGAYALTLDGTGDMNVSGVISGNGGLNKQGNATATLSGANAYLGATLVSGGTLKIGANNAITAASATTVASGATLDVNGKAQTLSAGLASSGTLALGTGGTLTLSGGTSSITGAVTGSGKIVVGSGATLTLTSALANSGVEIELAGGTLNLGNYVHGIGKLTVSAASTLDFDVGTAGLSAANLAVTASGTAQVLTVSNWTRGTDVFQAAQINGATATARNTAGLDPLSRIQMGGASAAATLWRDAGASPANEITTGIAQVRVQKITTGGVGGPFTFAQTNLASTPTNITTSTVGTATPASPAGIAVNAPGTAVTITETPMANYALTSANCTDANGATTGNTGSIGSVSGNVLTIPAANVKVGADLTCVFTNALLAFNYWDGTNTTSNNAVDGGTATWNATTTNWTNSGGTQNGIWKDGAVAMFQDYRGIVTIDNSQGVIKVGGYTDTTTEASNGTTLTGDPLTLSAPTNTITIQNTNSYSFIRSPIAGGSGNALVKEGAGNIFLESANTYSGTTTINTGGVWARTADAFGAPSAGTTIANSAVIYLSNTVPVTIAAEPLTISGNGWGAGALMAWGGNHTWGGPITLTGNGGMGVYNANASLTLSGPISLAGYMLRLQPNLASDTLTVSGVISGAGGLSKLVDGVGVLSAVNTYAGSTAVSAGTLRVGVTNAIPAASATSVASGATLDVNGKAQTLSAGLASSGTLALGTGGTLTLSGGTSSITGAVTGSGKIVVGSGATLTLTSALANSGVEIELAGGTLNLGNYVHGIGKLTVSAASTLDFDVGTAGLSATNFAVTASGTAQVLTVSNWTRGTDVFQAAQINGGTTTARSTVNQDPLNRIKLGGASAVNTLWTAITASPQNEITTGLATVKVQKTTLGGVGGPFSFTQTNLASNPADITTATAGTAAPASPAAITVIALGTAVTITESQVNPYALTGASCIDANGASNGNGTTNVATKSGNTVTIPLANVKAGADFTCMITNTYTELNHWDGGSTTVGGSTTGGDGGGGTWDANTTTNWTSSNGTPNGTWASGSVAIFEGTTGGTVNVSGAQSIGGLTFTTTGYTLSGGTLTGVASNNVITAGSGITATIGSVLAGSNAFEKAGAGTVKVTANNSYTGNTTVSEGVLEIAGGTIYGSSTAGTITVNSGATLRMSRTDAFGNAESTPAMRIKLVGGKLESNNTFTTVNSLSLDNGTLQTSGGIGSYGWGAFRLVGSVTSTGASVFATTPSTNNSFVHIGGTLTAGGSTTFDVTGTLAVSTVLRDDQRYGGNGYVASGLTKTGSGTMTISSANLFTGAVTVNSGILVASNATALGTIAAGTTVSSGASLGVSGSVGIGAEALTLNGSGAGGSTGALYNLSGTNTYGGAVTLGAAATIGSTAGTLTVTGTVDNASKLLTTSPASGAAIVLNGAISAAGGFIQDGLGTTTLGAANGYTGATVVNRGTLKLGAATNAITTTSATTVANGATLDVNGKAQTLSAGLASSGTLALGTGGTLTLSGGTSSIAGAVTGSGKIVVGSGATLTLTSALANSGVEIELAGGTLNLGNYVHGIGKLTVSAANAKLDFSSTSTSASPSRITAGTLVLGGNALSVTNWTRGTDRFYATAFTGATANTVGSTPMNQITLTGPVAYTPAVTVWQGDKEINVLLNPMVRIAKISTGGVGTFSFTMSGLSASSDAITTTASGTTVQGTAGITGTAGTAAVLTESGVPSGWPANPLSASCVDANGASNTNGTGTFGTLSGNALSVPAGRMIEGANITCTFVNGLNRLSGFVFDDGGAPSGGTNTGTPNDGRRNGAEPGLAGVAVTLTDCGATTHASTTTDNGGAWSLGIPAGVGAGATVCVSAAVPGAGVATGANAGAGSGTGNGTAIPDGTTVAVGGVAYTYSRSAQRLRFAAPAGGTATLSFGQVPGSTFGAAGNRQGVANTPIDHPHNFVAGTSGSLMLGIAVESANANGANASWSGTIHADPGCTGKVQGGAAQLYPGSTTVPVVQGQTVCVVVREVAPAGTDNGTVNQTTVWATLGFSNANPTLSASYTLVDTTTVGTSALVLLKEVRNVTTGGAWGTSNQARSGQVLEYRVTYTNATTSPMTKVTIGDSAPAYTVFQSAAAGTVPGDLGACTMNTPANPAPAAAVGCATAQPAGGTGAIRWMFDGRLNPGASGDVGFKVKVE